MIDVDKWREIWATLAANPLRTGLTALGVFWGIFMLMIMLTFGSALTSGSQKQMSGISSNAMFVWGQRTTVAHAGMRPGRPVQFDVDDIAPLRAMRGVEHVAPRLQLGGFMNGFNVTRLSKTGSFTVMADYPDLIKIVNLQVTAGRFLSSPDIADARKVCVIGTGVSEQLFSESENPIGQYIKISGVYFMVVGVVKTLRTGNMGDRDANTVHVPFTAFQRAFHTGNRVGFFALTLEPGANAPGLEAEIRQLMAKRHKVAPGDDLAIGSFNAFTMFRKIGGFFTGLNLLLWIVGTATLLSGVVGVSNIMLITVRERTKEFGVRKALGATPWSVVVMVMKESVVLTSASGGLGLAAGIGCMALATRVLADPSNKSPFGPPDVAMTTILAATAILIIAGALAGIMPAAHAAAIKPVEALRTE